MEIEKEKRRIKSIGDEYRAKGEGKINYLNQQIKRYENDAVLSRERADRLDKMLKDKIQTYKNRDSKIAKLKRILQERIRASMESKTALERLRQEIEKTRKDAELSRKGVDQMEISLKKKFELLKKEDAAKIAALMRDVEQEKAGRIEAEKIKIELERARNEAERRNSFIDNEKRELAMEKEKNSREIAEEKTKLAREVARIKSEEIEHIERAKSEKESFEKEKKRLQEAFKRIYDDEQKEINKAKQESDRAIERQRKIDEIEFAKKTASLKAEMENDMRERVKRAKEEEARKIQGMLADKEKLLRARLESEYHEKAMTEIRKKEIDFERKKAELERHVLDQAKKLFK